MKKTSIEVNHAEKVVTINVAGQMTMTDAEIFSNDYKTKIGPLNGSDYVLIVDCTDMKVLTSEMTENLINVMKTYKETGFKKVTYQVGNNKILKMQLSRLARNADLTQSEVVES